MVSDFNKALDGTSDSMTYRISSLGEQASDMIETLGYWIGDKIADVSNDKQFINQVLGYWGLLFISVSGLLAVVIKTFFDIIAATICSVLKILGGLLGFSVRIAVSGLLQLVSTLLGGIILIAGKFLTLIQTFSYIEHKHRRLTEEEIMLLATIFRESLAYNNIRLIEGWAGLFSLNRHPFVLGNSIYLKGRDIGREPELLIHECCHVWQYQHFGVRYAANALLAQVFLRDPYNWQDELRRGRRDWEQFNMEAQASFLEWFYRCGEQVDGDNENHYERFTVGSKSYNELTDHAMAFIWKHNLRRVSSKIESNRANTDV